MARPHPDPDLERLLDFVDRLQPLLGRIVGGLRPAMGRPREEQAARDAWTELRPYFDDLRDWFEHAPSAQTALADVGLTGKQLDFKMKCFNRAHGDFVKTPAKPSLRRRVLDWANRILGSLASAGAPGAEAVREFKDALEGMLGDGEE